MHSIITIIICLTLDPKRSLMMAVSANFMGYVEKYIGFSWGCLFLWLLVKIYWYYYYAGVIIAAPSDVNAMTSRQCHVSTLLYIGSLSLARQ